MIFSQFRETVFIPESLKQYHRRLIYRPSKHSLLTNDPGVTVNVSEEEEVRLRPMSIRDRPNLRQNFARISKLFGQASDIETWNNLFPFLEGLQQSGEKVPSTTAEKLIRRANAAGTYRAVIDCIEQPERTNVRLCDPFVTRAILQGCHDRAAEADFEGPELERSAKLAHHIAVLLDKKEHHPSRSRTYSKVDLRGSLFVNGVMLELDAARAINSQSSASDRAGVLSRIKDQLRDGVSKVLALSSSKRVGMLDLVTEQFSSAFKGSKSYSLGLAADRLMTMLPVWSGMELAARTKDLLSTELQAELKQRVQMAREAVDQAEKEVIAHAGGNLDRQALIMLAQLRKIHS